MSILYTTLKKEKDVLNIVYDGIRAIPISIIGITNNK